jgi:hypothetical protein
LHLHLNGDTDMTYQTVMSKIAASKRKDSRDGYVESIWQGQAAPKSAPSSPRLLAVDKHQSYQDFARKEHEEQFKLGEMHAHEQADAKAKHEAKLALIAEHEGMQAAARAENQAKFALVDTHSTHRRSASAAHSATAHEIDAHTRHARSASIDEQVRRVLSYTAAQQTKMLATLASQFGLSAKAPVVAPLSAPVSITPMVTTAPSAR